MKPAIVVENLGKRYRVNHQAERGGYKTLRESLVGMAAGAVRRLKNGGEEGTVEDFWALRDVEFEVKRGEVLGIIGRNGAGKSTLLKVLSRITKPTTGEVKLNGRVASLLEVGTGFHPELTGRENIFLNGSILGMSRTEIAKKFDEIVAFSEIEKFLDTPVKRYSSGMYVRLAFAVAAHLEPEILIVDEVLAVGDAAFQRKCFGKIRDVASGGGRTVLFVSHNMTAIAALCDTGVMMRSGRVVERGPADRIVELYNAEAAGRALNGGGDLSGLPRQGTGKAKFVSVDLGFYDSLGRPTEVMYGEGDLGIDLKVMAERAIDESNAAVIIYDNSGTRLIDVNTAIKGEFVTLESGGSTSVRFMLRNVLLRPGKYMIGLWLGRGGVETTDDVECVATFDVQPPPTGRHTEVFPGPYQCRFDVQMSKELVSPVE